MVPQIQIRPCLDFEGGIMRESGTHVVVLNKATIFACFGNKPNSDIVENQAMTSKAWHLRKHA
ncbi:hypothetical protein Fmac_003385 [Flemingia macrophylla]|uniref:Uncharacterized protein n=1 Tax=Flemingia macrophylla TaxID=520843 RepID=A0ABD1NQK4_9FABA